MTDYAAKPCIPGESDARVSMTEAARSLVLEVIRRHGPVMFHQSGGCCDGSAPMCYPAGEFMTGDADVLLGRFELRDDQQAAVPEVEFWMSREQFGYWRHTALILDAIPGRGAGFSLEAPLGKRFLIRSKLMNEPA